YGLRSVAWGVVPLWLRYLDAERRACRGPGDAVHHQAPGLLVVPQRRLGLLTEHAVNGDAAHATAPAVAQRRLQHPDSLPRVAWPQHKASGPRGRGHGRTWRLAVRPARVMHHR